MNGSEQILKLCACCGLQTLPVGSIFEICHFCGWQDDGLQKDDPTFAGGANELSLNEYREKWVARAKKLSSVSHFKFHYIDIARGSDGLPIMKLTCEEDCENDYYPDINPESEQAPCHTGPNGEQVPCRVVAAWPFPITNIGPLINLAVNQTGVGFIGTLPKEEADRFNAGEPISKPQH